MRRDGREREGEGEEEESLRKGTASTKRKEDTERMGRRAVIGCGRASGARGGGCRYWLQRDRSSPLRRVRACAFRVCQVRSFSASTCVLFPICILYHGILCNTLRFVYTVYIYLYIGMYYRVHTTEYSLLLERGLVGPKALESSERCERRGADHGPCASRRRAKEPIENSHVVTR